mmetsp:Transcript_18331/g.19099  ORF Transcript_18331/g.19099 Transcript_18331/m.19099 type:complete len:257 (-) Transcript_18331:129-899(-)
MFSTRLILKNSFKTIQKTSLKNIPNKLTTSTLFLRSFSEKKATKVQLSKNASVALSEVLHNEILHEQNEVEIDEDYEDIKEKVSKVFKITDNPGYGNVILERTYKGEHITVSFDCQDVMDDVQDESQYNNFGDQEETEFNGENLENEEFPPNKFGINFEVTVKKHNSKAIFYCVSSEDRVIIQNVTFVPEGIDDSKAYSGPKYEDLDPTLRDAFQNYLTERKIDDDFAFYILSEARNKEEREYRNWLTGLADFYAK